MREPHAGPRSLRECVRGEADQGGEGVRDAVLAFGSGPEELRIALGSFPQVLPVSGVRNGLDSEEGGIRVQHGERCRIFLSPVPEVRLEEGVFDLLVLIGGLVSQPFADGSRS